MKKSSFCIDKRQTPKYQKKREKKEKRKVQKIQWRKEKKDKETLTACLQKL